MENNTSRTALITGSYKGIGRSIALRLAHDGFNIVINYRSTSSSDAAEKTAEECRALGVRAEAFRADVSVESDCKALIDFTVSTLGSLDVLVNNAGTVSYGLLTRIKEEEYRRITESCQTSVFFMTKHAAKVMNKQKYGRIINIASMAGVNGFPGGFAYSAAKGAVIAMTKAASKELAAKNITVNAIAPGMIATDMSDIVDGERTAQVLKNIGMGRYGLPDEVAGTASYLASDDAAYTTGTVIEIHGSMIS
ncbi:MAG: 3-oxoacyl-ACP reductase FabG [Ruminococcus sp.]|nr:3-oxoacyl-ACP reductase FabG [Ruminococcus sp.]